MIFIILFDIQRMLDEDETSRKSIPKEFEDSYPSKKESFNAFDNSVHF